MTKSEKIISEFFKPHFEKYPELESLWFLIYDFDDGIYLADEDCGINGHRHDDLSDDTLEESSYKIQNAIKILEESKVDVGNIIVELNGIVNKLQTDAWNSNPLNEILENVWGENTRAELTKKVAKSLSKEIPWKYVDWCQCDVTRTSVSIEEFQRDSR